MPEFRDFRKHLVDGFTKLLQIPQEIADNYLQCNLNLYSPTSSLGPHRDDCTYNKKPTTLTFYPAAITYVLSDGTAQHRFELIRCEACERDEIATKIKEDEDKCKDDESHSLKKSSCFDENREIRLSGSNYLYGVHRVVAAANPHDYKAKPHGYRMSLNFRVVHREAWGIFSEPRVQ